MNTLLVRSILGFLLVSGGWAVPAVQAGGLGSLHAAAASAPAGFDAVSAARFDASLNKSMRAEVLRQLRVNLRAMLPRSVAGIAVQQEPKQELRRPLPAGRDVAQCSTAAAGRVPASC